MAKQAILRIRNHPFEILMNGNGRAVQPVSPLCSMTHNDAEWDYRDRVLAHLDINAN
jgi:hypothetical protein